MEPERKLARSGDPDTSHEGAEYIARKVGRHQRIILELVQKYPGNTARELQRMFHGADSQAVHKRIGEMERAGLVVRKGTKRCEVTGRKAMRIFARQASRETMLVPMERKPPPQWWNR